MTLDLVGNSRVAGVKYFIEELAGVSAVCGAQAFDAMETSMKSFIVIVLRIQTC
jgi:hypothetical protein